MTPIPSTPPTDYDANEAPDMSSADQAFQSIIDGLTPAQRVARSVDLFNWVRQTIARQIVAEAGPLSAETLKWRVALRLYGGDPVSRRMIEERLASVADRGL